MKRSFFYITIACLAMLSMQCTSNQQSSNSDSSKIAGKDTLSSKSKTDTVLVMGGINSKGIGRFNNITLGPIDEKMAAAGKGVYESKCFACHKLTNELLVGPGWAGVTTRRTPEWIMNWITNTKVMIDKDLAAQADMAVCLIRMPNQDLTDQQARDVLEFMRKNDTKN
jgi:cytochrome c1